MSETPKPSDQLPEEAPRPQVPDDVPEADEGAAREAGEAAADAARRAAPAERRRSADRRDAG